MRIVTGMMLNLREFREKNKSNINKILYIALISIIVSVIFINISDAFKYYTNQFDATEANCIESGETLTQNIYGISGKLKGFTVQFGTYRRVNKGVVQAELYINDTLAQQWNFAARELADNVYHEFELNKKINVSCSDKLTILVTEFFEGDNCIAVYTSSGGGELFSSNTRIDGTMCYQLIMENTRLMYCVVCVCLIVLLSLFIFLYFCIDFNNVNILKWLLVTAGSLALIETINTDIIQRVNTDVVMVPSITSDKSHEIAPGETWDSTFIANCTSFSALEFFIEGDTRSNISVCLIDQDSGKEYFNRELNDNEIIFDKVTGKVSARITADDKMFPIGTYHLFITNTSSDTIIQINAVEDDQGNQTINVAQIRMTGMGYYVAVLIILILILYVAVVCWLLKKSDFSVERFFLVSVIPLATIYLILMLPWSAPDTGAHFLASYRLSNILLGHSGEEDWMGRADDADFYRVFWQSGNPDMQDISAIAFNAHIKAENTQLVDLPGREEKMEYYSIVNYFPQVLGLCLGRILGLSSIVTIYIGRLFITIFYIWGCLHSVKNAPVGKFVFAMIPLLPMSLMMSSAYSYDAMVLVSTLNFTACILALYKKKDSLRLAVECAIWAFVIGATKGGGYLILLPLVFILVDKNRKESLKRLFTILVAGVSSVIIFDVILPAGSQLFQFGNEEVANLTASYAFTNPRDYLDMVIQTYLKYIDSLMINIGGTSLAWLENTIPCVVVIGLMLIMGIYSIYEHDGIELKVKDKWIFLLVIFIEFYFTPMMLLSWTPVGSTVVEGLQGRYYLPVLSLIIFVFTKFKLHNGMAELNNTKVNIIKGSCYKWATFLSFICVYYMMRLYLTR